MDDTLKLVAMVTRQGTACTETVLTEEEDTPIRRTEMEQQFSKGGWDDPIAGSWTDVSENDECQAIFRNDEEEN